MDIYFFFIVLIALVLVFILGANLYCIYQAFLEDTKGGLASLLAFLLGYALYLFFKLIEKELQLVTIENISQYFSNWEGRLLLALFCLLIGGLVGHIYLRRLFASGSSTITAFLILFLSLVHAGLVDAFFHLISSKSYTFHSILPSFSFVVALGFYFVWQLSKGSPGNHTKHQHPPSLDLKKKPGDIVKKPGKPAEPATDGDETLF